MSSMTNAFGRNVISKLAAGMACVLVALTFTIAAPAAKADEGLESLKGGLFHRKGWVSPEIHKKRVKVAKAQSTPRRAKPVRSKTKRSRSVKSRAAKRRSARSKATRSPTSQPRIRRIKRNRKVRSARNRIPARIVRKVEKKLTRAGRRSTRRNRKRVRVASLGKSLALPRAVKKRRESSITGGGAPVHWVARSSCVPARLRAAINYVARNYGRVRVTSTCRSRRHNRRVGGAKSSWHLRSRAADLRVFGNIGKAARYLRRVAGGYKHYGGGLFHIDTGPKRTW